MGDTRGSHDCEHDALPLCRAIRLPGEPCMESVPKSPYENMHMCVNTYAYYPESCERPLCKRISNVALKRLRPHSRADAKLTPSNKTEHQNPCCVNASAELRTPCQNCIQRWQHNMPPGEPSRVRDALLPIKRHGPGPHAPTPGVFCNMC